LIRECATKEKHEHCFVINFCEIIILFFIYSRENSNGVKMRSGRLARSRVDRRNTLDCALLNQMIIEPSIDEKARNDKRVIQQQREYERDQKNALAVNLHSRAPHRNSVSFDDQGHHESAVLKNTVSANSERKCIESSNRFMSVRSRPVGCRISAPATAFISLSFPKIATSESVPQTRREFHETFSNLIKLGSNDKQERNTKSIIISKEEQLWQTEVKDMIWLELQANMADRTLEQQDKYLFTARKNVGELLNEIMTYRFVRKYNRMDSAVSAKTIDSGISSMISTEDGPLSKYFLISKNN
jgi:mitogen-activated protein kinase kinase kinase 4